MIDRLRKKSPRLKDLELILRFISLYFYASKYQRPMKDFLNRNMASNRSLAKHDATELTALFETTVNAIHDALGPRAFRLKNAINAAVLDSVMVGIAGRLSKGSIKSSEHLTKAYANLLSNADYLGATGRATADEESVKTRLRLAKEAFADVA